MALNIPFGMSLPHRATELIDPASVKAVAQRAESLGFQDLWVTENPVDTAYSFDPISVLSYAASITNRVGLGTSVVVLPLRHPAHVAASYGTLDYLSGGRAILGVGLRRPSEYDELQVPSERRVRRFLEGVRLIKELWTQDEVDFQGEIYHFKGGIKLRPARQPRPPIWMGAGHPDAIKRAVTVADGWMGAGGQSTKAFLEAVPLVKAELERQGKDSTSFGVSKRIFMSVHEDAAKARAETEHFFAGVYHNAAITDANGIHGTPAQVRERLEQMVDAGANHLLLNPVCRYEEQVEALAEVVGLK